MTRAGLTVHQTGPRAGVVPDPTAAVPDVRELGPVHLIGIGGAGMSGIARLLLARGVRVSGSDAQESAVLAGLRAAGAKVFVGQRAQQVPAGATVVVTSAVKAVNPELVRARELGLRVLHRSAALAALMAGRRAVAVAGTHGKTTTTGMITVLLERVGLDPSFAIGGELTPAAGDGERTRGRGADDGAGEVFVAEADESDGSFLLYAPEVAVVTNIEPDHLDHYGSAEAVEAAFAAFCERVPAGGEVVACGDDDGVRRVVGAARPGLARRGVTVRFYGEGAGNDVRLVGVGPAEDGAVRFGLREAVGGQADHVGDVGAADHVGGAGRGDGGPDPVEPGPVEYGPVTLQVPGRHNAMNAAAAWLVARHFGVGGTPALEALTAFGGTRRRFEAKGEAGGVRVVDDYAHHPTEVAALLRAARAVAGRGRVIAVFQPHLFSRTRIFAADFGTALGLADEVVVLDVYPAREEPEPGVTGELISAQVPLPAGQVAFVPVAADAVAEVVRRARPGDLVLTVGAGDVTALGPAILRGLAG